MRILLADDGSAAAESARRFSVELARAMSAELVVVYVREPGDDQSAVDRAVGPARDAAASAGLEPKFITGEPVGITSAGRRIVEAATEEDADLIVVGARGHGAAKRLLLGSVSTHVVNHATCSVVVTREG